MVLVAIKVIFFLKFPDSAQRLLEIICTLTFNSFNLTLQLISTEEKKSSITLSILCELLTNFD